MKEGQVALTPNSEGKLKRAKTHKPKAVNVGELRAKVGMTLPNFAAAFGISLATLCLWERGDRAPHGPALVLLNLIENDPQTILKVLDYSLHPAGI